MTDLTPAGVSAAIFGCAGAQLAEDERAFFREARPWGFILFARNVEAPDQVRRLVADLRESAGWEAPVLIDQEGGRVARLRGPHWREWPPVGDWCDAVDDRAGNEASEDEPNLREQRLWRALALRHRLIGAELRALGIDVDCMPLLDVRAPEGHDIIGDRALGRAAERVAARGAVVCEALLAAGVLPVIKHLPGHGRAEADSHLALPVVDAPLDALRARDFAPFRALRDQPLAMTAHVVYSALDPERCATLSPVVIGETIRGEIGFDGLLMTDDLSMKALSGGFESRARESLAAGCDLVLHCNGDAEEMAAVMRAVDGLSDAGRQRSERALALRRTPDPFDATAAEQALSAVIGETGQV